MADWPQKVRDKLFISLLVVLIASLVGLAVTGLWPLLSAVGGWGPVAWASMVALVLIPIALFVWQRRVREAHARDAMDTFSFSEWVVRMRAKDEARTLIAA